MKTRVFNIIIFSAIASQQLAYVLSVVSETLHNWGIWFKLNALTHLILWGAFLLARKVLQINKWTQRFLSIGMALSLNQFLDELFFNPLVLGWNELAFGLLLSVVFIKIFK